MTLLPCVLAVLRNVPRMALSYVILGISSSSLYIGSTVHIGDRFLVVLGERFPFPVRGTDTPKPEAGSPVVDSGPISV
ncbi:MAG: hypothetical protein ABFD77_11235 [Thermotogota bacterium]